MKNEFTVKSYFFMTYKEWFYVDENYEIKLTNTAQTIHKCVVSYQKYLDDLEK